MEFLLVYVSIIIAMFIVTTIIEQIPKNAQTYPARVKRSSREAFLTPH